MNKIKLQRYVEDEDHPLGKSPLGDWVDYDDAMDVIASLQSSLAAERKRREEAEAERDTALSALNTERTMREAAASALTEWHGGIKQGQRIIDAEAYKRLWKETKADNARLREALEEINRRDTYSAKSYGPCAGIARAALNHEPKD